MTLQQRVRRRIWLLRSGQSLLAALAGGVSFGLLAAAEGRPPLPLALCGALLLGCLTLLVAKPWMPPTTAIDPQHDADGLLRTALTSDLSAQQQALLESQAEHRPLRLRPLPGWPAWGVLLALVSASAGWVLLEPDAAAPVALFGEGNLAGLSLDGRPSDQGAVLALTESSEPSKLGDKSPSSKDGEDGSEQGQWQRAKAVEDASALRLSLDLGVEQRVYERYLQNRAKNP
ncbi:MAG: hypothetical protein QM477_08475 [Planctomycetota bacterium]